MLSRLVSALLGLVLVDVQPAWAEGASALPRLPLPLPLQTFLTVQPVQPAPGTVLMVTPDRADWMYGANQPATLRIRVALDPYPAGGVVVRYRLGPEMLETPEQRHATDPLTQGPRIREWISEHARRP